MSLDNLIINLLPERMRDSYAKRYFNEKRRRSFYLKVAELYDNSVKIDEIVASMLRRAEKKNRNSLDCWLYKSIFRGLSNSGSFSEGIRPFVPVIDHILIKAGEQSGDLAKTLRSAADLNSKTSKMKGLIRGAVAYPCFMLIMMVGITCYFGTKFFPTMQDFLPVEQWPLLSRNMYGFAQFMLKYYWLVLAMMGALGFLVKWSLPNFTGAFRLKLDNIPPWSLYRLSQGGAWILSISSMVAAGTLNIEALNIIYNESAKNRWLRERTRAVRDNISKSQSMGEALTTKFNFPDAELVDDMADYAKTGNFNEIFESVGKEWIEVGVQKVEEQSAKLRVISTLFGMMCVLLLVISVISLTMTLANSNSMSMR